MIEENIKKNKKEEEKKTQTKRTRTRKENKTEKKGTQPTEEKRTRKPYQRRNTNKIMKQEKNEKSSKENNIFKKPKLKIIPLGGLHEIGKNITVFEYENEIIVVDCGLSFPDDDMLGVDLVIPDITYLEKNVDKIKGLVITHGHEDHIGGVPYLLKKINIPIYATRLAAGLIRNKLEEHKLLRSTKLNEVMQGQTIKLGKNFKVEFIRSSHSIPDSVMLAITTPAGTVLHTGDFKVDYTPVFGDAIDLQRFAEIGKKGVLALMCDSTNAERKGFTMSERTVGKTFDNLFAEHKNTRIIIATFASNVDRVQQIINSAYKYGRKVVVEGRSMVNVITTAAELGYLNIPDKTLIDIDEMSRYPDERIVLVTTGSQGEPMSALTRMAMNSHKKVVITPNDFIIISANPIPGNEKHVTRVVNELMKSGAEVIYEAMYEVHVSGHACQEELKLIQALTKPKFFIPVHGEYKHLVKHAQIAYSMGMPESNVIIGEIGNVIETDGVSMKVVSQVPSGRVMVDGLGVGDVGSIVLRDRKHLAQDGLIIVVIGIERTANLIVSGPDIISRGFVYVRESEELMEEARQILLDTLQHCSAQELKEWGTLKNKLRDVLSDYIYGKTKRSPMILPIIMEV